MRGLEECCSRRLREARAEVVEKIGLSERENACSNADVIYIDKSVKPYAEARELGAQKVRE